MKLTQALKMAAKSISGNKGRSALTMLGVIIGLAAVIILVSYAQGQNLAMEKYYESMGENKLTVYAYAYNNDVDLAEELSNYCQQISDCVAGITPNEYVWDVNIQYGVQSLGQNNNSYGVSIGGGVYVTDSYNTRPQFYLANDQFGLCNNYTLACGTGSCATVVACILNGLTDHTVTVKLLGGELEITWDTDKDTVYMTGPAVTVFDGEYEYCGCTGKEQLLNHDLIKAAAEKAR